MRFFCAASGSLLGGRDAIGARPLLEQAGDLFRAHGDVGGMGASLLSLGDLAL
jgi:hypothetical protein